MIVILLTVFNGVIHLFCIYSLNQAKVSQQSAAVDLTATTTANPTTTGATAASTVASSVDAASAAGLPARSILNATAAGGVDASGKVVPTNPASVAAAAASALGPQPGLPALQSSRLFSGIVPPVTLTGGVGEIGVTRLDTGMNGAMLSKKMLQKMNLYLRELDIPENPLPTKAVCDLVEQVKHSTVTLLSLHNALGRKEKELQLLLNGADPAVVLKEEAAPAPRCKHPSWAIFFTEIEFFLCALAWFMITSHTLVVIFNSQSSSALSTRWPPYRCVCSDCPATDLCRCC